MNRQIHKCTDRYTNVQTDIHIDVGTVRQIVDTYEAQTGRLPIERWKQWRLLASVLKTDREIERLNKIVKYWLKDRQAERKRDRQIKNGIVNCCIKDM